MHQKVRRGGGDATQGRAIMARKPKAGVGKPARPEPATGLLGLGQARREGKAPESAEERAARMALALALMETPETKLAEARALFDRLCSMMGEDEARAQWQEIAKRRRGRPLKVNQKRAEELCRLFDSVAHWIGRYDETLGRKVKPDTIIKIMAEIDMSRKGGQSVEAVAQEIRRALDARKAKHGLHSAPEAKRKRGRPKAGTIPPPVVTKIAD